MGYGLSVVGYQLWFVYYEFWVIICGLWVAPSAIVKFALSVCGCSGVHLLDQEAKRNAARKSRQFIDVPNFRSSLV